MPALSHAARALSCCRRGWRVDYRPAPPRRVQAMTWISLLQTIGGPGSLGFLATCAAIGLVVGLIGPRARRIGRAWLLALYVSYLVLGLPIVANRIAGPPGIRSTPIDLTGDNGSSVLVVLDGDNAIGRVQEA